MSDIVSVLSLQARARRNAREQLALVRRIRRERAIAEQALVTQPGVLEQPARSGS